MNVVLGAAKFESKLRCQKSCKMARAKAMQASLYTLLTDIGLTFHLSAILAHNICLFTLSSIASKNVISTCFFHLSQSSLQAKVILTLQVKTRAILWGNRTLGIDWVPLYEITWKQILFKLIPHTDSITSRLMTTMPKGSVQHKCCSFRKVDYIVKERRFSLLPHPNKIKKILICN